MYLSDNPDKGISAVQLNSDLQHAELELVSAQCATRHLRERYSPEEIARLGRRDLLRKSVEAASALNDFYQSVDRCIPEPENSPHQAPEATVEQIAQGVRWISDYLRQQRERYFPVGKPLGYVRRSALLPYFPARLLDRLRIVELERERVPAPEFLSEVRALGFQNLPDLPHMESLTFIDVIVFNETLGERALFHGLVHAVQMEVLGLEHYSERWIAGFLKTKTHYTVPLEVHAFSLASKFLRPFPERFSVEDQVVQWSGGNRY